MWSNLTRRQKRTGLLLSKCRSHVDLDHLDLQPRPRLESRRGSARLFNDHFRVIGVLGACFDGACGMFDCMLGN